MTSKAYTKALDFAEYCRQNPQLRFWQALLNWSGKSFILTADSSDGKNLRDTYYLED